MGELIRSSTEIIYNPASVRPLQSGTLCLLSVPSRKEKKDGGTQVSRLMFPEQSGVVLIMALSMRVYLPTPASRGVFSVRLSTTVSSLASHYEGFEERHDALVRSCQCGSCFRTPPQPRVIFSFLL